MIRKSLGNFWEKRLQKCEGGVQSWIDWSIWPANVTERYITVYRKGGNPPSPLSAHRDANPLMYGNGRAWPEPTNQSSSSWSLKHAPMGISTNRDPSNCWFRKGARRSESCVLIGFLSRQDGLILPSRDFPLWPRKKSSFRHVINPWHWKQGWLDRYGRINYLLNIWVITFLDRDGWIVAFAFLLTAISNKREFPVVSSRSVKRPKKGPWSITSHLNLTFGQ